MAFSDPQSITINAIANSLPRIGSGDNLGVFQKDDATVRLDFNHSYGRRTRRTVRITSSKTAADPLITGTNVKYSMSGFFIVDLPPTGYTIAETKLITDGFLAYLTASSGANVTKLLGGES